MSCRKESEGDIFATQYHKMKHVIENAFVKTFFTSTAFIITLAAFKLRSVDFYVTEKIQQ